MAVSFCLQTHQVLGVVGCHQSHLVARDSSLLAHYGIHDVPYCRVAFIQTNYGHENVYVHAAALHQELPQDLVDVYALWRRNRPQHHCFEARVDRRNRAPRSHGLVLLEKQSSYDALAD